MVVFDLGGRGEAKKKARPAKEVAGRAEVTFVTENSGYFAFVLFLALAPAAPFMAVRLPAAAVFLGDFAPARFVVVAIDDTPI
jgi:hypothetical protein